jgi:hypothetical protein
MEINPRLKGRLTSVLTLIWASLLIGSVLIHLDTYLHFANFQFSFNEMPFLGGFFLLLCFLTTGFIRNKENGLSENEIIVDFKLFEKRFGAGMAKSAKYAIYYLMVTFLLCIILNGFQVTQIYNGQYGAAQVGGKEPIGFRPLSEAKYMTMLARQVRAISSITTAFGLIFLIELMVQNSEDLHRAKNG